VHGRDRPILYPLYRLQFNEPVESGWASGLPKLQALAEISSKTDLELLNLSLALGICFNLETIPISVGGKGLRFG
jgi:hypothetical protein